MTTTAPRKPIPRWKRRRAVQAYAMLGNGPRSVLDLARLMDLSAHTTLLVVQYLVSMGDAERIRWTDDPEHPPGLLQRVYRRIEPGEDDA